jgi:cytoskeletal protein RodZ
MKTMRYRIRVLTLVLVCALLAVMLWTAKSIWVKAPEETPVPSAESLSPSLPDPWAEPTPAPSASSSSEETPSSWETASPPAGETRTPEALFDTFGL